MSESKNGRKGKTAGRLITKRIRKNFICQIKRCFRDIQLVLQEGKTRENIF